MTTFAEAPAFFRGLVELSFFVQFILIITLILASINHKRMFPTFIRNIVLTLMAGVEFLLYQLTVGLENKQGQVLAEYVHWFTSFPFWAICGISLVMIAELVVYLIYVFSWTEKHITPTSVKEAVDTLPGGICIYEDTGRIIIKNKVISDVARSMTKKPLLDGVAFKNAILSHEKSTLVGDKYITSIKNNKICSFAFDTLEDGINQYNFIICSDITEEYKKTLKLEETQREVMNLNVRLTQYNQEIVSAISAREVLDAKVKIHDELGTGLLAIKHYLTAGGTNEEKTQIVERVKRNIVYLKSEAEQKVYDEYDLMISTAKTLGVTIEVDGELPENEPNKHIIATAIHECFTNTLRHAKGNVLKISISQNKRNLVAVFTNNGEQPRDEIVEKGGLQSLHRLVTNCKGEMKVISLPEFSLQISLPIKED